MFEIVEFPAASDVDPGCSQRMAGLAVQFPPYPDCQSFPDALGQKILMSRSLTIVGSTMHEVLRPVCHLPDTDAGGVPLSRVPSLRPAAGQKPDDRSRRRPRSALSAPPEVRFTGVLPIRKWTRVCRRGNAGLASTTWHQAGPHRGTPIHLSQTQRKTSVLQRGPTFGDSTSFLSVPGVLDCALASQSNTFFEPTNIWSRVVERVRRVDHCLDPASHR
ncbi:hypothetical protein SAMN05444004_107131 [Jannaschia faecimaris]|uniref:Uncharacterized protein n=1 Tax=Jannaschia faecimaris TaxID=1244108 RepID=A0A1H3R2U5_9RHOB|nr:hypothetical protein SAMN05444004_107131 [Jannaschia faecimaris]